jgi:16S rRNA (guanine966-N2)-methyltransferase
VIGGAFRSRRLKTLPGQDVRPTPDRLREALFNVLAPRIDNSVFLDAYAGTGAVGIEALSRGARKAIFVEGNRRAVQVIRENLAALGLETLAQVVHGKTHLYLESLPADIAFIDPPYERDREYSDALEILGRTAPALVIAQHAARFPLGDAYGALQRKRILKQGDNALSFYEPVTRSS